MTELPEVPLIWGATDAVPIQMANQFLLQSDFVEDLFDVFVLTIGQVLPPPLHGTDEQKQAQLNQIESVEVTPMARFSITPSRLVQLRDMLISAVDSLNARNARSDEGPSSGQASQ